MRPTSGERNSPICRTVSPPAATRDKEPAVVATHTTKNALDVLGLAWPTREEVTGER